MNSVNKSLTELSVEHATAINQASSLIAPSWPLDRFIAVNALWEFREQTIESASARVGALQGLKTTMSADYYLDLFEQGDISESALIESAKAYDATTVTVDELKAILEQPQPNAALSIAEIADLSRDHNKMRWQDEIVHQVSQFCGEFVNQEPENFDHLYSAWLDFTRHDYGMSLLMGEKKLRHAFTQLPDNPDSLFAQAVAELELSPQQLELYAHKLLMCINGWASYFAWQRWENRLNNQQTACVEALLAIRIAWDLIIWRQLKSKPGQVEFSALKQQWQHQKASLMSRIAAHHDYACHYWIWAYAAELSYQRQLQKTLSQTAKPLDSTPVLQAAFCIDVRSERIRRNLELQSEAIQTIGFAGFFGLPITYQPAQTQANRPQLPGLIAPSVIVSEQRPNHKKLNKVSNSSTWKNWASSPVSSFTMVETMGWTYAYKLIKDNFFSKKKEKLIDEFTHHQDWQLTQNHTELSLLEKVNLVTGVLKGMGLTKTFASTILLLGHGSETRNNLHASGLDCGACCGQSGEVNVRVLTSLLNDPAIRTELQKADIHIPEQTRFIAGLHNTTTDEIVCFDTLNNDDIEAWLKQASIETRRERVQIMDAALKDLDDASLEKSLKDRGKDWSEVRPEWGLANNASFIVAPRQRTRGLDLQGRSFLHDYDWQSDAEFALLEQIMTAPMIVTQWINMQYNLSVTDNTFFGSGNKLLHNAVGQHVGVFEGNGGDLRIGLAMQSIHDGEQWRHQPLRLSVYIAAPKQAIENVIAKHKTVRDLVENGWLFILQWSDDNSFARYQNSGWHEAK
ncbi:YbcC family protein [Methylophaga thalassica]|uniref:YbcC family protein n=1 Tax=Methylophaga aminisulfidivorans TaxID=230105 RepID=UPI003A91AC6C